MSSDPALTLSDKVVEEARDLFVKHDKDKSGSIDKGEVPGLLRELNLRLSPDLYDRYCTRFFTEADLDHSSTISFQEFLVMFDRVFTPNRLFGAKLRAAAGRGQADVVLDLVSRGCNPNAGDGKGWSAVHHAAEYGHVEPIRVMQKLYGADLDIDAEDTAGWRPLFNAAANGNLDVLSHLIASGAQVDAVDNLGRTALHCAASGGHTQAVATLLAAGLDPTIADKSGWTALFCAAIGQHIGCLRALLAVGAKGRRSSAVTVQDVIGNTYAHYCDADTLEELAAAQSVAPSRQASPRSPRA